jgi:SAM-dependent methyltransferase
MVINRQQATWSEPMGLNKPGRNNATPALCLRPTERLFIEKTLLKLYPRLHRHDLFPWKLLHGPLIPDILVKNTGLHLRRILVIGCGDGVLCNILSLLFPTIEIVGLDTSPEKIATARATVGHRQNLKFICGSIGNTLEIPCDRIIYNHCLETLGSSTAFKKLMAKTLRWLSPNGDFMVREAPLRLLKHPRLLKEFFPQLTRHFHLEAGIRHLLAEMGYMHPKAFYCNRLPGIISEVYFQSLKEPGQTVSDGLQETVQEWQELGDQSTHSVLGFLFAQPADDFEFHDR